MSQNDRSLQSGHKEQMYNNEEEDITPHCLANNVSSYLASYAPAKWLFYV